MSRLKDIYHTEIVPKLRNDFSYKILYGSSADQEDCC